MNVWFVGDLHFGHRNICRYRPEFKTVQEHDEYIAKKVLSKGSKRDTLVLMGDCFFTRESLEHLREFRKAFRKIVWVLGNHCVSPDTEILTSEGWKFITEVTKETLVLSVDLKTKKGEFVHPEEIIYNPSSELFSAVSPWHNEIVSSYHNLVINNELVPAREATNKEYKNNEFLKALNPSNEGIDLTDDWIRLLTWVVMDGCIVRSSEKKTRVQFKLSKEKKITKLKELLERMGIPYTFRETKKTQEQNLQPYYIRIYGEYSLKIHSALNDVKKLPKSFERLNLEQTKVFLEALCDTDGTKEYNRITWHTISKDDIDTVQIMCALNGFQTKYRIKEKTSGFANGKPQYFLMINTSEEFKSKGKVKVESYGIGETYGLRVKHGTILTRRNGCVQVTGNCSESQEKQGNIRIALREGLVDDVHALWSYKGFWISHAPIHPEELRGKKNIHAHTHNYKIKDSFNYRSVSLEQINYTPISLHALQEEFKNKEQEKKALEMISQC